MSREKRERSVEREINVEVIITSVYSRSTNIIKRERVMRVIKCLKLDYNPTDRDELAEVVVVTLLLLLPQHKK